MDQRRDPDALSMFDSEGSGGPAPAAEPSGSQTHVQSRSDDVVRVVRQRMQENHSEASVSRSILSRATVAKFAIAESARQGGSRVALAIRDYLIQNPKLPLRAASIACILIIGFVVAVIVGGSNSGSPSASNDLVASEHVNQFVCALRCVRFVGAGGATETSSCREHRKWRAVAEQCRRCDSTTQSPETCSRRSSFPTPRNDIRGAVPSRPARTQVSNTVQVPPPAVGAIAPDGAPPLALSSTSIAPTTQNDEEASVVYSEQDRDVRPPQIIEADLPRPAVASWATIKNAMELVVAGDGTVERVKWLGSPQRMPDVMLLSRAKVWKFAPASKDGHPVRYRLVLTWEVNP